MLGFILLILGLRASTKVVLIEVMSKSYMSNLLALTLTCCLLFQHLVCLCVFVSICGSPSVSQSRPTVCTGRRDSLSCVR